MDFKDLKTAFDIGKIDDDAAVETAWTQEGFIKNIRTVGRSDQDDPFIRIESIHFDEKLVQCLLSFIMAPADARPAMASDSVDLIDEDDARSMFFRLVEHIADTASADADKHFDEVRTGDEEEGTVSFAGNRFGDQVFYLFLERRPSAPLWECVRQEQ